MASARYWETRGPLACLLLPLAVLFALLAGARRWAYRVGLLKVQRIDVPVLVVGNITVGGTGKTPLVTWLVQHLSALGYRPGIVSRGYGGKASKWPQQVRPDSDPVMVGDEAVLLAAATGCPVCVAPDRPAAARALLTYQDCDIIVSDDGLQHYALGRDLEVAVIDGARRFGNGWPLPAGPMREPQSRLRRCDFVVVQGGEPALNEHGLTLTRPTVTPLRGGVGEELAAWRGRRVHAVAGIGNPQRFFDMLEQAGLEVVAHPFADHHPFAGADLDFGDDVPVLMTAKDAVKCRRFARDHHHVVSVEALPDASFVEALDNKLKELPRG